MEISVKIVYKNEKLQAARKAAGMSQSQLASAAGVSVRLLQDYERGGRDINGAKLITLLRLCNAMGCSLGDILNDEDTIKQLEDYEQKSEGKK